MAEKQLFLVRVWQHLSQFRASVRSVDEEEPRLFTEPGQLGEFFRSKCVLPHAQSNGGQHENEP